MEKKPMSATTKLVLIMVVFSLISTVIGMYVDWLWFDSVHFASVYVTILTNKVILYLLLFALAFAVIWFNLQFTRKHMSEEPPRPTDPDRQVIYLDQEGPPNLWKLFMRGRASQWFFILGSLFGAFVVSSSAAGQWLVVQQFFKRVPVGLADPLFGMDIGFYFFNLHFYEYVYSTLMLLLVLVLILVGVVYALNASSDLLLGDWRQFTVAKSHIAILLALILILKAWGYHLDAFGVLLSSQGIVFGATYSDIHANLPAYRMLSVVSLMVAAVILINIFVKRINWVLISLATWMVVAVVMGSIYPAAVQKLVVQPNEFNKEKPYIQNAIDFTRAAYALDRADIRPFNNNYQLDITKPENQATINNIRLWDWQPLMVTYQNLQQLRSYYVFNDVDVDRYTINGQYRQIMVAGREIDQNALPDTAKTWINQRLMYTHGYGVLASPVNEIAQEGFPNFLIKDIPPQVDPSFKLTRPEIYFGERTNNWVMVNTNQQEFDYPMGDKNMYSVYQGEDGIKIKSWPRRLLLSWYLKDYKMLLSTDINNNSQLLMRRIITQRVQAIAPYLQYDADPYMVMNDDGRMYWILDGYTTSKMFPYSKPYPGGNGNNYIRNAVKVTCDAYSGEMHFYIADDSDPIIKTYSKIFPGLYYPLSDMPAGLQKHLRYPVDVFSVQVATYSTFHMLDPNVFYNNEDPWLIPKEMVNDKQQDMEPYYTIMRLPDSSQPEYVLMMPFTPKNRPNMVGWMAGRMDGENYGKLMVYEFDKQSTIYGPEQIESRINQDTVISQQLTLWDQKGSRVYRGNMMVIPFDTSVLYVEPIYLQAESSKLPELKRIIVGFGNTIVMDSNLEGALNQIFSHGGKTAAGQTATTAPAQPGAVDTVQTLTRQAREFYDLAQQKLQAGDWTGYGDNLNKLNDTIKRLEALTQQ